MCWGGTSRWGYASNYESTKESVSAGNVGKVRGGSESRDECRAISSKWRPNSLRRRSSAVPAASSGHSGWSWCIRPGNRYRAPGRHRFNPVRSICGEPWTRRRVRAGIPPFGPCVASIRAVPGLCPSLLQTAATQRRRGLRRAWVCGFEPVRLGVGRAFGFDLAAGRSLRPAVARVRVTARPTNVASRR
jgi:hypothetical protein